MTQDEIIEIAQMCKLIGMRPHLDGIYSEALVAFAKLVAAKEREACAKVCELGLPIATNLNALDDMEMWGNKFAKAIRERGKQA